MTREEWNKALYERHGEKLQKKFESASVAYVVLVGSVLTLLFLLHVPVLGN